MGSPTGRSRILLDSLPTIYSFPLMAHLQHELETTAAAEEERTKAAADEEKMKQAVTEMKQAKRALVPSHAFHSSSYHKELECDAVERAAEERKKAEGEMRMWQAAAEKAAAEKKQAKGALDLSQTQHSLTTGLSFAPHLKIKELKWAVAERAAEERKNAAPDGEKKMKQAAVEEKQVKRALVLSHTFHSFS
ncbi:MAG: hypothetical protein SGPRY_000594 [Prymnesium sp.]